MIQNHLLESVIFLRSATFKSFNRKINNNVNNHGPPTEITRKEYKLQLKPWIND